MRFQISNFLPNFPNFFGIGYLENSLKIFFFLRIVVSASFKTYAYIFFIFYMFRERGRSPTLHAKCVTESAALPPAKQKKKLRA